MTKCVDHNKNKIKLNLKNYLKEIENRKGVAAQPAATYFFLFIFFLK
jgi:hypothetical protein